MEVGAHSQPNILMNPNLSKASPELKGNRVILVCIHNVSGTIITHELLYKIFSRFGKVLRILIFDKAQIWKSFVEFSTPEAAIEAKNRVNNMILFSDGSKITIYPSNLDTIKFQKNNSGGVDYTVLDNLNIYGIKDQPPPLQDPRIFNPQEQNYPNYPTLPPPQIGQPYQYDPHAPQAQLNAQPNLSIPNQGGILTPTSATPIELIQVKTGQSPADISNGGTSVSKDTSSKATDDQSVKENKQFEEEKGDADASEREFNALIAEVFQTKPTSKKAQVTHVHSVPAQLYRDNPSLQQPQPQPTPTITETPVTGTSAPPGLFPMQNKPVVGGPMPLNQNPVMSMNFIPFTDPSQQQPPYMRTLNPMGAPMVQLPQTGSLNNIPMMTAPMHGGMMGAQPGQFFPMGQPRPQLNRPYMSQPELPMMGDRMNPMMGQMNVPYFPDPNARAINPAGMEGGIPQPGGEGFEYANLTNMNRSTLSQLHDNISLLLGKGDDNKKSKVLYVKGLEHKDIKVHMLHNIFSNFGNILKIIYIPSKSAALVEFENPDYSTICMDYLNNVVFMTKPLRIFYSKYTIINLKNKKGDDGAIEEVFIGNPKTFRFKKNKNISINPPSSTLHLSNLVKEVCTEETIRTYFNPYGRVEAVKFIFMENNKNMCLVRMSSIEESLNAMAYLHDTELDGRKVQISFTRSRI